MDEKKEKVIAKLEDAVNQAETVIEYLKLHIDSVGYCETAEELWDKICEIEENIIDAELIADWVQEAFEEADNELYAMVEAEREAEAEEEA